MQTASQPTEPLGLFSGKPRPRLYDRVTEVLRVHHYSLRTERAYVHWIRRFFLFHRPHHPRRLSEADANRFLTHGLNRPGISIQSPMDQLKGIS